MSRRFLVAVLGAAVAAGVSHQAMAEEKYTLHDVGSNAQGLAGGRVITARLIGNQFHGGVWSPAEGFIDFGPPAGTTANGRWGVGDIFTGFTSDPGGHARGFLWTAPAGPFVDLGPFIPRRVSEDGSLVAGYSSDPFYPYSGHANVWTAATGVMDIGNLGGSQPSATAVAVSEDIVTGFSNPRTVFGSPDETQSFVWTPDGGMVQIGPIPGLVASLPADMEHGQIVGLSWGLLNGAKQSRGFSWTAAGGMIDIGPFWPVRVRGGEVVGGGNPSDPTPGYPLQSPAHAFYWSGAGGLRDLQSAALTAKGLDRSFAVDVSDGHAVGYVASFDQTRIHAMLWTAGTGMVDITPCGWSWAQAQNIDEDGNIAGGGIGPDGKFHGFLLTPGRSQQPELTVPADALALACPADVHVCGSPGPVSFPAPVAAGGCGGTEIVCAPPSGSSFPAGATTVVCTATDAAGSSATCSTHVVVDAAGFEGFLPPIDGIDGTFLDPVRTFKLGSTIPVKFKTTCGGSDTAPTVTMSKWASATNVDPPIDATPTDAATDGNLARLTDGTWHYNLSTKALSPGVWRLVVTLAGGATESVFLQLR